MTLGSATASILYCMCSGAERFACLGLDAFDGASNA